MNTIQTLLSQQVSGKEPGRNLTHMSTEATKLAFNSQCLPGSAAERQEEERIAEFLRNKALREAEEKRSLPERIAQREAAYQAAFEANQERMRRGKIARSATSRIVAPSASVS